MTKFASFFGLPEPRTPAPAAPTSLPECLTSSSSRRSLSQRRTPDVPMPRTPPSSSQTPSPSLRALSRPPSAVPSIEFIPIPMIPSGYKGRTPSIGSMLNPTTRRGQSVDARRKGGALRGDAVAASSSSSSSSFQGSATLSLQRGRRSVSMDTRSRSR